MKDQAGHVLHNGKEKRARALTGLVEKH